MPSHMVVSHNLHLGWSNVARAAAVVILACRLEGIPRTAKVICHAAGVKSGQANHIYRVLLRDLEIVVPPPDPASFVGFIAQECDIPEKVRQSTILFLRHITPRMTGKDPTTLAAAALYKMCCYHDHSITQKMIADAANISTVSLRLRRLDLEMAAAPNQSPLPKDCP